MEVTLLDGVASEGDVALVRLLNMAKYKWNLQPSCVDEFPDDIYLSHEKAQRNYLCLFERDIWALRGACLDKRRDV